MPCSTGEGPTGRTVSSAAASLEEPSVSEVSKQPWSGFPCGLGQRAEVDISEHECSGDSPRYMWTLDILPFRQTNHVCLCVQLNFGSVRVSYLGTTDILDQMNLCWGRGGCPSIKGCLAASLACTHLMPVVRTKSVPRHCQMSPQGVLP